MSVAIAAVLLWIQVQLGAFRVLERVPGVWGEASLAAVWAASAYGAWALLRGRLRLPWRWLATPWPSVALVALVAVAAAVVYPEVDGRRSTGGGSDADDAVVLVAERVRDGLDPFGADTYLGNAPTTGPGSVLWAAPFPTRTAYASSVVIALGAALALLRRRHGSWEIPSLVAVLLGSSFPFWESVAQANDHLSMAVWLAVVVGSTAPAGVTGFAAGVLATWRAAYLHLPLLLALAVWRRSRRDAVILAVVGTGVALVLHAVLLLWTDGGWDAYDPVQQLFVKSDEELTAWGRALLVAAVGVAAFVVVIEATRPEPREEVLVLAGIGGPLGAIAVAGLLTADEPAAWSEASYLLPTLVLAAVVAAKWVVASRSP